MEKETMKKVARWDRRVYNVKPEIVADVFEQLEEEFGEVTPDNFLEASTPEESPTHKLFEWNDIKAAHLYRRNQARHIITDLKIEYIVNDKPLVVPAYVNVSSSLDGSGLYRNITRAFETRETREIVLNRAKQELSIFRKKYAILKELASVMDAIGEVLGDG